MAFANKRLIISITLKFCNVTDDRMTEIIHTAFGAVFKRNHNKAQYLTFVSKYTARTYLLISISQ